MGQIKDNCQICRGIKGGVRGNENRVFNIVMCDYCTVSTEQLIRNVVNATKESIAKVVESYEILDYNTPTELATLIRNKNVQC